MDTTDTGRQVAAWGGGGGATSGSGRPSGGLVADVLTLTCPEERQLVETNLKQIGLALTQYSQDFDEHYPPSEGINEAFYPYLHTRDVLQVGSHRFVYQLPGGISPAKIESPSETPQGMIDLPCARVMLFADGHVKSLPKPVIAP